MSKKLVTLLNLCVSSLRRGHANLLCITLILSDAPPGITSATDGPSLLISPCLLSFVLASVPMSFIPQQCLLAAACHTCPRRQSTLGSGIPLTRLSWAEARVKIASMTLTIKLDGTWSSFQLATSAPPLRVTDSAIALPQGSSISSQQLLT